MLSGNQHVQAVYIAGSRTPLSRKKPTPDSDWDLIVVSDLGRVLKLLAPRIYFKLHADVIVLKPEQLQYKPDAVMIWPTDEYGILTNE